MGATNMLDILFTRKHVQYLWCAEINQILVSNNSQNGTGMMLCFVSSFLSVTPVFRLVLKQVQLNFCLNF